MSARRHDLGLEVELRAYAPCRERARLSRRIERCAHVSFADAPRRRRIGRKGEPDVLRHRYDADRRGLYTGREQLRALSIVDNDARRSGSKGVLCLGLERQTDPVLGSSALDQGILIRPERLSLEIGGRPEIAVEDSVVGVEGDRLPLGHAGVDALDLAVAGREAQCIAYDHGVVIRRRDRDGPACDGGRGHDAVVGIGARHVDRAQSHARFVSRRNGDRYALGLRRFESPVEPAFVAALPGCRKPDAHIDRIDVELERIVDGLDVSR